MHFACSIGQDIENAILSINTVTLYVIIFALLGLLIFLFVRNALKRHKFTATSDSDVFEEMDRRSRQSNADETGCWMLCYAVLDDCPAHDDMMALCASCIESISFK